MGYKYTQTVLQMASPDRSGIAGSRGLQTGHSGFSGLRPLGSGKGDSGDGWRHH